MLYIIVPSSWQLNRRGANSTNFIVVLYAEVQVELKEVTATIRAAGNHREIFLHIVCLFEVQKLQYRSKKIKKQYLVQIKSYIKAMRAIRDF